MNRVIKFRAIRLYGKGWVFGFLYWSEEIAYILPLDSIAPYQCVQVIPESVCQFTGLLDNNGEEIYDGDMVLASMKYKGVTLMPFRAYVFYNDSVGSWQIKYETTTNNFATDFIYSYEIEVIGNINENKKEG